MELVSQASLLAAQTERRAAPGTAADRARLRTPAGPVAGSPSVGRREGAAPQRSFPVDQIDVRTRTDNRGDRAAGALKSANLNTGIEAQANEASERSERSESSSRQRSESERAGVGRRESPFSNAPARPLAPGSRLNITA